MKIYQIPINFDGAKFADRYGLNPMTDFWSDGINLHVPDGLPDDPPIFDPPDPFVPVPAGIKVHHWPELLGWIGSHKIFAIENGGDSHHECYYVIAETEASLDGFATMPHVNFKVGQPAYLKDKKLLVIWDGTKWK